MNGIPQTCYTNVFEETLRTASTPSAFTNPLARTRARSSFAHRVFEKRKKKSGKKYIATERNATSERRKQKRKNSNAKRKLRTKLRKKIIKPWESLNVAQILEARTVSFPSGALNLPASIFPRLSPTRLARAGCHFRLVFVRPSVWPLARPRSPAIAHSCLRHSTDRVLFLILILRIFGNARAGMAGVTINYGEKRERDDRVGEEHGSADVDKMLLVWWDS